MNKTRTYAVADAIEKDNQHFNMDAFYGGPAGWELNGEEVPVDLEDVHKCGTAMCVGGWAHFLFKDKAPKSIDHQDYESVAEWALGLDPVRGSDLFYAAGVGFKNINSLKAYVPAALRWMADNNNVNWRMALLAVGVRESELDWDYG